MSPHRGQVVLMQRHARSLRMLVLVWLCSSCRFGYELLTSDVDGSGASAGAPDNAGGTEGLLAGSPGVGGVAGSTTLGGTAGNGLTAGGDVGGFGGMAGEAGAGAEAGADAGAGLPPIGCADAMVWSTDFSSDPSALEENGDGIADWVVRGGGAFPASTLAGGVWVAPANVALDTSPPFNFTGHTQLRVRMRDTATSPPSFPFPGYGGALSWINYDYRGDDFYAVFASISLPRAAERELAVYAVTQAGEVLLGSRLLPDPGAFVTIEVDIPAGSGDLAVWVDGVPLPTATAPRRVVPNQDRFATLIAPQSNAEFDEFWVATCPP